MLNDSSNLFLLGMINPPQPSIETRIGPCQNDSSLCRGMVKVSSSWGLFRLISVQGFRFVFFCLGFSGFEVYYLQSYGNVSVSRR